MQPPEGHIRVPNPQGADALTMGVVFFFALLAANALYQVAKQVVCALSC